MPATPGLSIDTTFYSAGAGAGRTASFTRGGRIEVGLDTTSNYFMLTPSYAFETPVLGGQVAVGVTALWGNYSSAVSATLVAPSGRSLSGSIGDFYDGVRRNLFPTASLRWNHGVHNFMALPMSPPTFRSAPTT